MILIELILYISVIVAIPGILNISNIYTPYTFKFSNIYLVYSAIISIILAYIIFSLTINFMIDNREIIKNIFSYKIW